METHSFFSCVSDRIFPFASYILFYFCKFFRKIYIFEYNAPFSGSSISLSVIFITVSFLIFIHSIVEGYIYFPSFSGRAVMHKKIIPNTTTHPTISITI